jgi:hypothetical protein
VSKKKPKTIGASYPLSFMGCEGEVIVEMTPTEAVSMIEKAWQENKRLRQENATLTAERDEARRELCRIESSASGDPNMTSRAVASDLGWDCFKEDGK